MGDMTEPRLAISIVRANQATWEDLETVSARGAQRPCAGASGTSCGRGRRSGSSRSRNVHAGYGSRPDAAIRTPAGTSGLVAYLDGEPVGWCAVEPRSAYEGLIRNARVPWEGREEDKTDDSIWAVTCLFTRVGFRRRGVSRALACAAVDFARERGARAIEAYPMTSTDVIAEELHVGTERVFAQAGFVEVSRPTPRRVVMRIDF